MSEKEKTASQTYQDEVVAKAEKDLKARIQQNFAKIKRVIIVLSGKGGVGKSSVTVNLAAALSSDKKTKVGVLDADFQGPVIPIMMGLRRGKMERDSGGNALPLEGPLGIKVASLGFFVPEGVPYTLRGVLKYEVMRELLYQLDWGQLDYLLLDLPPGTSDDALNVVLTLPRIDGAVIVTIPPEVSAMPVEKSVVFCKEFRVRVLGIVENMAEFECPHCGRAIEAFGEGGHSEALAHAEKVPILGKVPFDPRMSRLADSGTPFITKFPDSRVAKSFFDIVAKIEDQLPPDLPEAKDPTVPAAES